MPPDIAWPCFTAERAAARAAASAANQPSSCRRRRRRRRQAQALLADGAPCAGCHAQPGMGAHRHRAGHAGLAQLQPAGTCKQGVAWRGCCFELQYDQVHRQLALHRHPLCMPTCVNTAAVLHLLCLLCRTAPSSCVWWTCASPTRRTSGAMCTRRANRCLGLPCLCPACALAALTRRASYRRLHLPAQLPCR